MKQAALIRKSNYLRKLYERKKQSIIAFCIKQDSWELILEEFIFINVSEATARLDESGTLSSTVWWDLQLRCLIKFSLEVFKKLQVGLFESVSGKR